MENQSNERQVNLDKIRARIEQNDRMIGLFGMRVVEVQEGYAVVEMTVEERHLNAAKLCHGAAIMALADVAFALASNSHGILALALEVSMNYLRPVHLNETIKAVCEEVNLGKTTGLYITKVFNSEQKLVALMKATAYRFADKKLD